MKEVLNLKIPENDIRVLRKQFLLLKKTMSINKVNWMIPSMVKEQMSANFKRNSFADVLNGNSRKKF